MSDRTIDRPFAPRGLIAPIQYLRGFAAMLVVWHHGQEQFPSLKTLFDSQFGPSGVDLFFVISGFIMVVTTANSDATALRFVRRRIVRVVPLYWLLTATLVAVALVAPSLFRSVQPSFAHVVKSLLFIPHESPSHAGMLWPVLVPGWTLNFEMFFYAIFALSLCVKPASRFAVLLILFAALVGAGFVWGPFDSPALRTYTSPLLIEFVVGAAIAKLWLAGRTRWPLALAAAAMVAGLALLLSRGTSLSVYAQIVGAGLLVAGALDEHVAQWKSQVLQAMGDASYSIYLTHLFTLGAMRWLWTKASLVPQGWIGGIVFMALGLCASAWVGWLVYRSLEAPLLSRLNALTDARSSKRGLARAGGSA